jgi:type II secretory pathway pseudopilin PulG
MLDRCGQIIRRSVRRRSLGATLVEVVIAVVVLGLLTSAVPPVLVMVTKAEYRRDERRVAEALIRMQMEYVKSAAYVHNYGNETERVYAVVPVPDESYLVNVDVVPVHIDPETRAHTPLAAALDEGIQEITVEVYHVDKNVGMDTPVLAAKDYKVDR